MADETAVSFASAVKTNVEEEKTERPLLPVGPQPDVKYPIKVVYCGECGLPVEYCDFYPDYDKCRAWLERNFPDEFEKLLNINEQKTGKPGEAKDEGT